MKLYRKYLVVFTVAMLLGLIVQPLLFYINLGVPNKAAYNVNNWFQIKDEYAGSIDSPKIVFISGSNTLFGVDTEKIENELGIPTVNYGVHAGFKFYILQRAKHHLHKRDVVVLPLEYGFYDYSDTEWGEEHALHVMGYDHAYFEAMPVTNKISCIQAIKIQDLIKLTFMRKGPLAPDENNHYSGKYLNVNGDMTYNPLDERLSEKELNSRIGKHVFRVKPLSKDAKKELSNFINYCHQNEVIVYAAWPNYLWKEKVFSGSDLDGINAIESFYREHNVEIIGSYTDCLYDAKLFYDTTDHLNEEGKRIHTDYLIRLLKEKLNQRNASSAFNE